MTFLGFLVSKWYPDAMLAKTMSTIYIYLFIFFSVKQEPRSVQLLSQPYFGYVSFSAGPAQFGVDLREKEAVGSPVWSMSAWSVCWLINLIVTHQVQLFYGNTWRGDINPLMLTAAKSSPTMLMIFCRQKQCQENIWWRNDNQSVTYNSSSNIFKNHSHFQSYCQKYHWSRRQFLEEL